MEERKFLGVTIRRWLEYLVAILVRQCDLLFFVCVRIYLPLAASKHQGFSLDWAASLDFVVCVAIYGLIRMTSKL